MKKLILIAPFVITLLTVKAQDCPKSFHVIAPSEVTAGDTLVFIAEVSGNAITVTYNWSISAGTIISGQGTSMIMVNTDSLGGQTATATVELGGLPRECGITNSSTTMIMPAAEKIFSINYTTTLVLQATIRNFILQTDLMVSSISQSAFVYIYGSPTTTPAQKKKLQTIIEDTFIKNGIFSYQFKVADGGKRKKTTIEIFRLMAGVKEPKPSL